MKNKKFWNIVTVFAVMFFAAFAFISCGDDDDNDGVNPLIGSWAREDASLSEPAPGDGLFSVLTFKSDGTYVQTWVDCVGGEVTKEYNFGRWQSEGSRITITWQDGGTVMATYRIDNGVLTLYPPEGVEGAPGIFTNVNKNTFPDYVKESLNYE